ncbi:hypothetical protein EB001_13680 [bacterium]|nr:hypothetical protein [bacterium]
MKTKQNKFNCDLNGSIMVMAALRYALGRHSYVPGAVQDWISLHWDSLDSNTKTVIVRDVFEHMYYEKRSPYQSASGAIGQYDLSTWEKFGIDKYWKLDYNQRKSVDLDLTSDKDRARWFAERLYGTQPI